MKSQRLSRPLYGGTAHCQVTSIQYLQYTQRGGDRVARETVRPQALTIRSRLSASTLPRSMTAPESFLAAKSASKQRCQLVTATSRQLDSVLGSAIATREVIIATPFVLFIDLHKGAQTCSQNRN